MKAVIRIMSSRAGDYPYEYDTEVEEQLSEAEKLFDAQLADESRNWLAAATLPDGDEVFVTEFPKTAVKILMFPQISGG